MNHCAHDPAIDHCDCVVPCLFCGEAVLPGDVTFGTAHLDCVRRAVGVPEDACRTCGGTGDDRGIPCAGCGGGDPWSGLSGPESFR